MLYRAYMTIAIIMKIPALYSTRPNRFLVIRAKLVERQNLAGSSSQDPVNSVKCCLCLSKIDMQRKSGNIAATKWRISYRISPKTIGLLLIL